MISEEVLGEINNYGKSLYSKTKSWLVWGTKGWLGKVGRCPESRRIPAYLVSNDDYIGE